MPSTPRTSRCCRTWSWRPSTRRCVRPWSCRARRPAWAAWTRRPRWTPSAGSGAWAGSVGRAEPAAAGSPAQGRRIAPPAGARGRRPARPARPAPGHGARQAPRHRQPHRPAPRLPPAARNAGGRTRARRRDPRRQGAHHPLRGLLQPRRRAALRDLHGRAPRRGAHLRRRGARRRDPHRADARVPRPLPRAGRRALAHRRGRAGGPQDRPALRPAGGRRAASPRGRAGDEPDHDGGGDRAPHRRRRPRTGARRHGHAPRLRPPGRRRSGVRRRGDARAGVRGPARRVGAGNARLPGAFSAHRRSKARPCGHRRVGGTLTLPPATGILARVTVPVDDMAARRDAYLAGLLTRRSARARAAIDDALADGVPIAEIYLEILQPALYEIGHRWAIDQLNVAEEHYATAVTQQLLDELSARMRKPPRDGRLAVVTGTPGELHALGPRMVGDFLEADGWEVIQLGAATPAPDLAELVDDERPEVVALSTATAGSLPGIVDVLGRLRALDPRPCLVVGGQFWTAETSRAGPELGADLVLRDLRRLAPALRERVPPPAEG